MFLALSVLMHARGDIQVDMHMQINIESMYPYCSYSIMYVKTGKNIIEHLYPVLIQAFTSIL